MKIIHSNVTDSTVLKN